MSPAKPNTRKRPRGEGAVFQRCDTERGCPPREPVLNDDGTPVLTKSGNPKLARPLHKCRGLWVARLDLGDGADGKSNRPQRTSATRNGAVRKLKDLKEQLIKYGDVPRRNITVKQWMDKWIEEFVKPNNGPGTYQNDKSRINVHINPGIGNHRLERLQPQHLRDLYAEMKENGKIGMRPGVHRTIHKALNDAMRNEGLVVRNVASLVTAPGGKGTKRQALTAAEGRRYIKQVHREDEDGKLIDPFASRWVMALLTGARQGECLGLEVDRVDLKKRKMDVSWQLRRLHFSHGCGTAPSDGDRWPCGRRRAGACPERFFDLPDEYECRQLDGGLCLVRPKSEAGIRMLPIPTPLHADLVVHLETGTGPNPHGLVWRESDGSPIDGADDRARWKANLKAAGLPPVLLHEAKHTTVTLLMEAGVDPEIIKAIAGHSSLAVQEGYKHVNIQHMADALGHVAGTLYLEESSS